MASQKPHECWVACYEYIVQKHLFLDNIFVTFPEALAAYSQNKRASWTPVSLTTACDAAACRFADERIPHGHGIAIAQKDRDDIDPAGFVPWSAANAAIGGFFLSDLLPQEVERPLAQRFGVTREHLMKGVPLTIQLKTVQPLGQSKGAEVMQNLDVVCGGRSQAATQFSSCRPG